MRRLAGVAVVSILLSALAVPAMYFHYAKAVPEFGSRDQILRMISDSIEAERRSLGIAGAKYPKYVPIPFEKLPKIVVNGALAIDACPDYVTARKEVGWPRARRLLRRVTEQGVTRGGPHACHVLYADRIAGALGIVDPVQAAIADGRILDALTPEELLSIRLSGSFYSPGVFGVHEAARALFKKEIDQLNLLQIAEVLAAESSFPDFLNCKNPAQLKMEKDIVLDQMEAFRVIGSTEANATRAKQVTCFHKPD